jgi:5-carboxymethyl-2-hydroxymuconic-semialdehyde dehydrogenase
MTATLSESHGAPGGLPGRLDHFIGGAWSPSADGATFAVADPVSNRAYTQVAAGSAADIDRAARAAHRAFTEGSWPPCRPAAGPDPEQDRTRWCPGSRSPARPPPGR